MRSSLIYNNLNLNKLLSFHVDFSESLTVNPFPFFRWRRRVAIGLQVFPMKFYLLISACMKYKCVDKFNWLTIDSCIIISSEIKMNTIDQEVGYMPSRYSIAYNNYARS